MKTHYLTTIFLLSVANILLSQTWELQTTPGNGGPYYCTFFTNENSGWVGGMSGFIYHTTDGGNNWEQQISNTYSWLDGAYFINDSTGWFVGALIQGSIILSTMNYGNDWYQNTILGTDDLNSIFFINDTTGWTVGSNGHILKTTDKGLSWQLLITLVNNNLNKITFTDINNGWAVGDNGIILKTTDGGLSWTQKTPSNADYLRDVFFVDSLIGWACGPDGIILSTIDGGNQWTTQSTATSDPVFSLFFINEYIGWATGYHILYTTDGGNNWQIQSEIYSSLYDIYFTDINNGWTVGDGGQIYHTSDGGLILNVEDSSPCKLPAQIVPNPAKDKIKIIADSEVSLRIFTFEGKIVDKKEISPNEILDISFLPKGLYLFKIYIHDISLTEKVLVE